MGGPYHALVQMPEALKVTQSGPATARRQPAQKILDCLYKSIYINLQDLGTCEFLAGWTSVSLQKLSSTCQRLFHKKKQQRFTESVPSMWGPCEFPWNLCLPTSQFPTEATHDFPARPRLKVRVSTETWKFSWDHGTKVGEKLPDV